MIQTLVIGYGNELRGDDGAGPAVARLIAAQEIPGVAVEICHQLLPEHAAKIAAAECVVFVDAAAGDADEISVRRIQPASHPEFCGHRCDPEKLLHWCSLLASRVPQAWFVQIPAADFGIGEKLSQKTRRHVRDAVVLILRMVKDHAGTVLVSAAERE
ncbi:MAG: hydrogenase maturation protease [Verrucomicrobiaceae bacterium]|nr:MAG: hydrogenase maturation protease [Verrucomicrobiaceae bacterium]